MERDLSNLENHCKAFPKCSTSVSACFQQAKTQDLVGAPHPASHILMFPLFASKMLLSRQSLSDMGSSFNTGGQIVPVGKQFGICMCMYFIYIYIYIFLYTLYHTSISHLPNEDFTYQCDTTGPTRPTRSLGGSVATALEVWTATGAGASAGTVAMGTADAMGWMVFKGLPTSKANLGTVTSLTMLVKPGVSVALFVTGVGAGTGVGDSGSTRDGLANVALGGVEDTALAGLGVSTGTGVALPTEEAWANRAGCWKSSLHGFTHLLMAFFTSQA